MNFNKSASKMMTRTLSVLALTAGVAAASVADNQDMIASKVDSANAHRGLEVTGAIRGIAQASYYDNSQDKYVTNTMPDVERNEFVNADFNVGFRPWESVRANAMLRLYAGMQDYFASAAKFIEVPWINVEGQIGNNFYWIVGDFRQQYSPLTLFAPDIDIMYEPQVFARKRHMAEKQQLLDGNQRNLQGVNLQFRADLGEALGQIRAEGIFARLNRAQALDLSGAEGNILPNDTLPGSTQASNTDKFLLAGNLELLPLNKNLYLGATAMYIFDNEDSYTYAYRHPMGDLNEPYQQEYINPFELDPQKTIVAAGRLGGDVAGIVGSKNLILDLTAEAAMSMDQVSSTTKLVHLSAENKDAVPFDLNGDGIVGADEYFAIDSHTKTFEMEKETQNGMAINANFNVGYKTDSWGVRLVGDVIKNDSLWFNNLAQSPKFFAQRILNSDYDGNTKGQTTNKVTITPRSTVKYGVNSQLYSTFDALYNFAPKFAPVSKSLRTDDKAFEEQPESYNIAPYNKNSWTGDVYSKAQIALLNAMSDPAIQMILPNGMATANRTGGRATLIGSIDDWFEAQALFGTFSQTSPLYGFKNVAYMEYGAGLKADIFKAAGFTRPFEVSISFRHSERSLEYDPAVYAAIGMPVPGNAEMKTNFLNAGLYLQYLPRLGFTAGLQMVTMTMNESQQTQSVTDYAAIAVVAPLVKGTQIQWMVGLDYSLDKHAWLSLNFGIVSVDNTYNTTAENAKDAVNVPASAWVHWDDREGIDEKDKKHITELGPEYNNKFSQYIIEASINVEF